MHHLDHLRMKALKSGLKNSPLKMIIKRILNFPSANLMRLILEMTAAAPNLSFDH